ncbi:hypothetical protein ALMP_67550 [Streptomyces sp. A012304]|nr:hypothetical protein ALMP_67550 [Streptomyces sp. A012304]
MCGGPDVLRDVDEVEQDVDGDVAALGCGVDGAELVVGAVDELAVLHVAHLLG